MNSKLIGQSLLLFFILACTGCASINDSMESMMWHDESYLIAHWGPPQQIMDNPSGGKIFVYSTSRSITTPGYANVTSPGSIIYSPPITSSYNAYRMFWLNSCGNVYKWSWKGL